MSFLSKLFVRFALTAAFLLLTLGIAAFLFPQQFLTVDSGNVTGDELVVLGGGDGRAEAAAQLYKEGVAPGVLVTGDGDWQLNAQILEKGGVPVGAITIEPHSLNTYENAEFSVPLLRKLGAHRVILVTSWFHSRRALACFRHFSSDIRFYSRPSYAEFEPTKPNREGFSELVNIEYAKLLEYWFVRGIGPF